MSHGRGFPARPPPGWRQQETPQPPSGQLHQTPRSVYSAPRAQRLPEPGSGVSPWDPPAGRTSLPYEPGFGSASAQLPPTSAAPAYPPSRTFEQAPAGGRGVTGSSGFGAIGGSSMLSSRGHVDLAPGPASYVGHAAYPSRDMDTGPQVSPLRRSFDQDMADSRSLSEYSGESVVYRPTGSESAPPTRGSQKRHSHRDEFDGPTQFLDGPLAGYVAVGERDLPHLPTNVYLHEQDKILSQINDCLSKCAFNFVAKYQFPIPLEPDKRPVSKPEDREWTEWVHLLKRLATKRRIPARLLYNGQIKQLVTVLENSSETRHAAKHQSRPLKDDWNVLQLLSASVQVTKILKDAGAMDHLARLYLQTEQLIQTRKRSQLAAPTRE